MLTNIPHFPLKLSLSGNPQVFQMIALPHYLLPAHLIHLFLLIPFFLQLWNKMSPQSACLTHHRLRSLYLSLVRFFLSHHMMSWVTSLPNKPKRFQSKSLNTYKNMAGSLTSFSVLFNHSLHLGNLPVLLPTGVHRCCLQIKCLAQLLSILDFPFNNYHANSWAFVP